MELFDTHFVYYGHVLLVSGLKVLVVTGRSSGKITTTPRLVSIHLIKNENKHLIVNVHTKWNCLIPILSTMGMYYLFQPENVSSNWPIMTSGEITTAPRVVSEHFIKN